MHPGIEALLAVRDGEADAATAAHVAACTECRREVARLEALRAELRALPGEAPSRDLWPAARARLGGRRRARWAAMGAVAAAACLLLTVAVRQYAPAPAPAPAEAGAPQELASLLRESRTLEQALRIADRPGRALDGRTASLIATLEDHIAVVDAHIAGAAERRAPASEVVPLWQQRVALLGALNDAQVHPASYIGL